MSDTTQNTGATPVNEPVSAAPAVVEPVAAPILPPAETPAPAESVVEAVTEAPVAEKPAETTAEEPLSLLEQAKADAPKVDEAKPAEKPPEAAQVAQVYEPFKLPEGLVADEKAMATAVEVFGKHNLPQAVAQDLVELHAAALLQYAEQYKATAAVEQQRIFAETQRQWADRTKADEQLGGASHLTVMSAIARMRDRFVSPDHAPEFQNFLKYTGAGNHPAFLRFLHNVSLVLDEPSVPSVDFKPPPNNGRPPGRGNSRVIYDHPSSTRAAG